MSQSKKLRGAVVIMLQAGHGVDMRADLSVYPSEGSFLVECFLGDEGLNLNGLTPDQLEQATETGEIAEYFPTAEEAADCYLQLCEWLEQAILAASTRVPGKPTRAPEPVEDEEDEEDEVAGVRDLTHVDFDERVLSAEGAALVVLWSGGTGADRGLLAVVELLAESYPGVLFGRLDVDSHRDIAAQYGVKSVPACLVFKAGELVKVLSGPGQDKQLRAALDAVK